MLFCSDAFVGGWLISMITLSLDWLSLIFLPELRFELNSFVLYFISLSLFLVLCDALMKSYIDSHVSNQTMSLYICITVSYKPSWSVSMLNAKLVCKWELWDTELLLFPNFYLEIWTTFWINFSAKLVCFFVRMCFKFDF